MSVSPLRSPGYFSATHPAGPRGQGRPAASNRSGPFAIRHGDFRRHPDRLKAACGTPWENRGRGPPGLRRRWPVTPLARRPESPMSGRGRRVRRRRRNRGETRRTPHDQQGKPEGARTKEGSVDRAGANASEARDGSRTQGTRRGIKRGQEDSPGAGRKNRNCSPRWRTLRLLASFGLKLKAGPGKLRFAYIGSTAQPDQPPQLAIAPTVRGTRKQRPPRAHRHRSLAPTPPRSNSRGGRRQAQSGARARIKDQRAAVPGPSPGPPTLRGARVWICRRLAEPAPPALSTPPGLP